MTMMHVDTHEVVAPEDLKPLAAATGPCLTAVVPLPDPTQNETHVRNAIRALQKKLEEQGLDSGSLLQPLSDLVIAAKDAGLWAHSVILFRSPDLFRYYLLHGPFNAVQELGERFMIRPLLQTLAHETQFHLLALSQKNVRLLHCTQHRLEPETTRIFPRSLEEWMNSRQPDHVLENRSSAGPSVGNMKGVLSGTNTDREREDEYLRHFFKEVDKGVVERLRGRSGPLLLAGVEYEIAIYQRVNSYKPTLDKTIVGSPDGMPEHTLHARAMDVVTSTYSEPVQKVMAKLRELVGTAHASTDPRAIVQAAFQGRVSDLVIADGAEFWGAWNEETQEVEADRREELLNTAALQTIRHAGRAFELNQQDMPVKAAAAAVFRY